MPSSYTPNLRLVLPVQGELSGTWGDTVNTGITSLTDAAIAGTASIAMTDADHTLTSSNGVSDQARNMFVVLTGALTASRNVVCPAVSKLYFVYNNTTGSQNIVFKTSGGTGVTVPNGTRMALYCDGINVVDAATNFSTLKIGNLNALTSANLLAGTGINVNTAGGNTTVSNAGVTSLTGTSSQVVVSTSTGAVTLSLPATINVNTSGSAANVSGTVAIANGGTGATSAATAQVNLGVRTSDTGSIKGSAGTTAQRDVSPAAGYIRYNTTLSAEEVYSGTAWNITAYRDVAQTFTASQRGAVTVDNDLSFDMAVGNNFSCTPTAGGALTFTNITAGQSGFIFLVNSGNYAITPAATTKISAANLAMISETGTYLMSYFSPDGTNVYVSAGATA